MAHIKLLASLAACAIALVSSTASSQTIYTPYSYESILTKVYTPGPKLTYSASGITTNRGRYLISDSATTSATTNFLSLGLPLNNAISGYYLESGVIQTKTATYQQYFSKYFQLVAGSTDKSGFYRIDSHLNPNFSLDADSKNSFKLNFRNNLGKASTTYGYVVFSYSATTHLLQAKGRYLYSLMPTTIGRDPAYSPTYTWDSQFAAKGVNYYVKRVNGSYYLDPSANNATRLYFHTPSDNYAIPSRMNPGPLAYSLTNPAAPFVSQGITPVNLETTIQAQINSKYSAQVVGSTISRKLAADNFLKSIPPDMLKGVNGGKLRYAPELYTAFRDAALMGKLKINSVADGIQGQSLIPFIYYTNEKDSSGVYHPMMNIITYTQQATPHGLLDVASPPCVGQCSPTAPVTREPNLQYYIASIPMRNYGQVSTTANDPSKGNAHPSGSTSSRWKDDLVLGVGCSGISTSGTVKGSGKSCPLYDPYNYASTADNGILIDGTVIYPALNNVLTPSQWKGELSLYGCHIGQGGGGPHCHADGFQSGQTIVTLYGDYDYIGKTHPPLIGFGYDGVALFAVYRSQDTNMLGAKILLDKFGGHAHNNIGYHYHAHVTNVTSWYDYTAPGPNNFPITAAKNPLNILLKGAWAGNINYVPCFMPSGKDFDHNQYLGGRATGDPSGCTANLGPAPNL